MKITLNKNKYNLKIDGTTQSLFANYLKCPMCFTLASSGLNRSTESFPMTLGSYGHHVNQYLRLGKKVPPFEFPNERTPEEREFIKAAIMAVCEEYNKIYPIFTLEKKFYKAEVLIDNVKLPNGVVLRGKIDGLCRSIMTENKFKARISEDDFDICLQNDFQIMWYCMLNYLKGNIITKVNYDVLRYPSFSKKKPSEVYDSIKADIKKDPDHWIKRWVIDIAENDIKKFMDYIVIVTNEALERKYWYKNTCACKSMFTCQYMKYCYLGRDPELKIKPLFGELYEKGYSRL